MQKTTPGQNLSEKAYQIVEEMIVTLGLPPGTIFSETDLSRQIGVGRTPLREALKRMATERLVVSIPRRGIMVTEINITDQILLLETRRALDRLIAIRAARRATADQRAQLQTFAAEICRAAETGDLTEYMRIDYEFDELLTDAARNPFATGAVAPLHAHSRRFWVAYRAYGDWARIAQLHASLMNNVANANEAEAAAASESLIDCLEDFTRTVIESI